MKILQHGRMIVAVAVLCAQAAHALQEPSPADPLAPARAFLASDQLPQSETWLNIYLRSHPFSADAHFLLGYVLFREQKAKDSLSEFTEGAKVRRPNAEELLTVGSDYVLLADYSDADKWFTEVTRITPNDANAWYLLGRTRYNENLFDQAATAFQRTLVLHPRYVEAENNLGLCLKELNNSSEAARSFETAIEWEGSTPLDAQPFLNLGMLLTDEGDLDKATSYLQKAASIAPKNPKTHEELGAAYQAQKNFHQAQFEYEQAVALAPDSSALHFKLGQVYRKQGSMELARREFDICAKINSTHSSSTTPNPYLPPSPTARQP